MATTASATVDLVAASRLEFIARCVSSGTPSAPTPREVVHHHRQQQQQHPRWTGVAGGSGRRPNVLMFFTDQQRADWFEMNSAVPVRTPHVKTLAERGVWLPNAVSPPR
jgi:hypothetical protein